MRVARPWSWPEALRDYIVSAQNEHDACTFVRSAVLAVGGPDLGGPWAGTDQDQALAAACATAGLAEIAPAAARRGDVLIMCDPATAEGRPLAAICTGGYGAAATPIGLTRMPMRAVTRAWAI